MLEKKRQLLQRELAKQLEQQEPDAAQKRTTKPQSKVLKEPSKSPRSSTNSSSDSEDSTASSQSTDSKRSKRSKLSRPMERDRRNTSGGGKKSEKANKAKGKGKKAANQRPHSLSPDRHGRWSGFISSYLPFHHWTTWTSQVTQDRLPKEKSSRRDQQQHSRDPRWNRSETSLAFIALQFLKVKLMKWNLWLVFKSVGPAQANSTAKSKTGSQSSQKRVKQRKKAKAKAKRTPSMNVFKCTCNTMWHWFLIH